MSPTIRVMSAVALGLVAIVSLPAPTLSQVQVVQQGAGVSTARLAAQLGVKPSPDQSQYLDVGGTLNGALADPAKLAKLGMPPMHEGARVTAVLIAPNKLRVEVDEMDPEPITRKATFRIDDKGDLVLVK